MENIIDNREEILKAVKEDGKIYSCLLKAWRNDKEIFKEAFKTNKLAIQLAGEEIKKDRELIKELIQDNGWILEYIDKSFRDDTELVLMAD